MGSFPRWTCEINPVDSGKVSSGTKSSKNLLAHERITQFYTFFLKTLQSKCILQGVLLCFLLGIHLIFGWVKCSPPEDVPVVVQGSGQSSRLRHRVQVGLQVLRRQPAAFPPDPGAAAGEQGLQRLQQRRQQTAELAESFPEEHGHAAAATAWFTLCVHVIHIWLLSDSNVELQFGESLADVDLERFGVSGLVTISDSKLALKLTNYSNFSCRDFFF